MHKNKHGKKFGIIFSHVKNINELNRYQEYKRPLLLNVEQTVVSKQVTKNRFYHKIAQQVSFEETKSLKTKLLS